MKAAHKGGKAKNDQFKGRIHSAKTGEAKEKQSRPQAALEPKTALHSSELQPTYRRCRLNRVESHLSTRPVSGPAPMRVTHICSESN